MKLFTISTICALLATITHAIPGPLVPAPDVPAPALPAPIIEARQSAIPFAFLILIGTNNVGISTQISTTNVFVQISTAPNFHVTTIFLFSFRPRPVLCTLSTSAGENITISSSVPLVPVGSGQTFTGIICN